MVATVTRSQILGFRVRAQQLDVSSVALADSAVLDIGVQDTGPDGARWALANRGVDVSLLCADDLVKVWTIRAAPHLYLRASLPSVAAAVQPFSDADAGKRIFDASKPLKAAGISNLEALDTVAAAMRSLVTKPMSKGDVSTAMTALMDPPYLRFCRPCNTTHMFEMPFRLAALRAGLELEPDTSPPVLRRLPGFKRAASASPNQSERYDVVRAYLRLFGPATPKEVASYIDAPVKDVKDRWPADVVEVSAEGEPKWVLAADADNLSAEPVTTTRLLGPFDLFLQARDRRVLVNDPVRAKALWPVLGRPGAVLIDGEIAGLWRPRKSGKSMRVRIELWSMGSGAGASSGANPSGAGASSATTSSATTSSDAVRAAIGEQAERLAAYRGVRLAGIDLDA